MPRVDDVLSAALDRARSGQESGFVELWRTLQPPLLRYLTVRGEESPEDLASETWLQVIRDLDRFKGTIAEFRAWLFTVARNRAIDASRRRGARPAIPVAEPGDVAGPAPALAPSAETVATENSATAAALSLVATLPAAQAEMVMLRVVAGLDVADVARIVGKQPGTVRTAVHRGLNILAERIEVNR